MTGKTAVEAAGWLGEQFPVAVGGLTMRALQPFQSGRRFLQPHIPALMAVRGVWGGRPRTAGLLRDEFYWTP